MGNLRDTVESHVAQPIPSYAEMAATASDRSEVSIFVDLPKEGEGPLNFSSFKETLGVLIAKDNIRCNGYIYVILPNLEDANKIKEILGNSPSFSNLKSSIASKENPKFIIKFTDYSEESALLEQLKLKNTIFKDVTVTTVFKIKVTNKFHWIIEVPPAIFRTVDRLGALYLGASRHRVSEFISIRHCKKCGQYGHTTSKCSYANALCMKCGAEPHTGTCSPKCIICTGKNATNDGLNEIYSTSHKTGTDQCPEHRRQTRLAKGRVNHGP
ncbi:hypothetical protein JTE90_028367 [Oedothorax gibbosus]|uniref:CCHC-type domain-containing protein n=1 Tax=Oedothorax gibbosus TaxID=931172 RepID=A0AAV6TRG2_9ARAC|nr:hypothetical protein JTE90_028367 [Oedothorax gibbosus]